MVNDEDRSEKMVIMCSHLVTNRNFTISTFSNDKLKLYDQLLVGQKGSRRQNPSVMNFVIFEQSAILWLHD